MELRQLRYFARIVELGSVSKAAKDLLIAQPALSKHIQALEIELKTPLLTRSVRGIAPTEAGAELYRHAQAILRQIDRLPDDVRQASESPGGFVSIGIPSSVANILAAPLVAAVHGQCPGVQLHISEGASGYLEELLASGRLDISLLYDRQRRTQKLHIDPILLEDLFLLSSQTSDKSRAHDIALAGLAKYPLILPGPMSTTRQIVEAAAAKAGLSITVLAEIEAISTMKSLVREGLGAAILSRAALYPEDALNLSVRRIVRPHLQRGVCLCTSRTAPVSRGAHAVIDIVQRTARQLIRSGAWRNVTELPQ